MIGDLFDSPWKILIVAIVIIVLFGSAKLPAAARSLGKSMRILKTEASSLHDDGTRPRAGRRLRLSSRRPRPRLWRPSRPSRRRVVAASQPSTQQVAEGAAHQARIDSLEQQIRELKDSANQKAAVPADQQPR